MFYSWGSLGIYTLGILGRCFFSPGFELLRFTCQVIRCIAYLSRPLIQRWHIQWCAAGMDGRFFSDEGALCCAGCPVWCWHRHWSDVTPLLDGEWLSQEIILCIKPNKIVASTKQPTSIDWCRISSINSSEECSSPSLSRFFSHSSSMNVAAVWVNPSEFSLRRSWTPHPYPHQTHQTPF